MVVSQSIFSPNYIPWKSKTIKKISLFVYPGIVDYKTLLKSWSLPKRSLDPPGYSKVLVKLQATGFQSTPGPAKTHQFTEALGNFGTVPAAAAQDVHNRTNVPWSEGSATGIFFSLVSR